jgi:hypothetical protein
LTSDIGRPCAGGFAGCTGRLLVEVVVGWAGLHAGDDVRSISSAVEVVGWGACERRESERGRKRG